MERDQLTELHFITLIENLPSILERGILSHVLAEEVEHTSVAAAEIQDIRAGKTVPGGRPLHEHANLYFHARNPMMAKRQERHAELGVVRVSVDVLDLPDVVISSQNASSTYAAFRASLDGLHQLPPPCRGQKSAANVAKSSGLPESGDRILRRCQKRSQMR